MGRKRKGKGETGKKGTKKATEAAKMVAKEGRQGEEYQNGHQPSGKSAPSTPPRRRTRQSARLAQRNGTTEEIITTGGEQETQGKPEPSSQSSSIRDLYHFTILPLVMLIFIPNLILMIWWIGAKCDGSIVELGRQFAERGVAGFLVHMWSSVSCFNPLVWSVILIYCVWAAVLHLLVPGPRVEGPLTPKGHLPVYKDNGFYCYILTMNAFAVLTYVLKTYYNVSPTVIYDNFGDMLLSLCVLSGILCLLLYIKGHVAPSTADSGSSGNHLFDYYWGMELYPNILGIDIKVFTNCRFGMTIWPLLITIFALKSYETYGFVDSMWVSWALQMIYCTKFFWWEAGYMRTIDIMVDRAGFYICWGCMTYVPGMYTSVSFHLVKHPVHLGIMTSSAIFTAGVACILVNYIADMQKQKVRETRGDCLIWGKKPEVIRAKYQLEGGETRENLLLVSGWWGVARHFNYDAELCLSLCWSLPALFQHFMPYTYVIYLTILLVHRSYRDEDKCQAKYGRYWQQYVEKVPYKMIPGIF